MVGGILSYRVGLSKKENIKGVIIVVMRVYIFCHEVVIRRALFIPTFVLALEVFTSVIIFEYLYVDLRLTTSKTS